MKNVIVKISKRIDPFGNGHMVLIKVVALTISYPTIITAHSCLWLKERTEGQIDNDIRTYFNI